MVEPAPVESDKNVFNQTPRVCLIGITGTGKSTFGNGLCGEDFFKCGAGKNAVTEEAVQKEAFWFGKESEAKFFCLDTCGFSDPEGRDESQLEALIKNLETYCYVNAFLVVMNSTQPRLEQQIKNMFRKLKEVFKLKVFEHIMIVFTRWEYSIRKIKSREIQGVSEATKKEEINEYFRTELEHDTVNHPVSCVFLDSLSFTDPLCEAEELVSLTAQFQKVRDFCISAKQFLTMGLKEYLFLKKNLDQAKAEDRELFEKLIEQDEKLEVIITRHPELAKSIQMMKKNENDQRYRNQLNLERRLRRYFDNRDNITLVPSLLNDIWEINNEFNQNDTWRLSKSNLLKDMQANLKDELYARMEQNVRSFIEEEAHEFIQQSQTNLKELLSEFNISISLQDLIKEAATFTTTVVAVAFAGAGALFLAELGLVALLGIVGMIVVAVAGVFTLISSASWDREKTAKELTKMVIDRIATNEIRKILIEISTKALDKVMLKIISIKKETLINQFSQENNFT